MQTALLASLLELGSELGAAIDLQGADGKRHAMLQGIKIWRAIPKWRQVRATFVLLLRKSIQAKRARAARLNSTPTPANRRE